MESQQNQLSAVISGLSTGEASGTTSRAIDHFSHDDLIMSATAYYLGRRTHLVDNHCQCLVLAWPRLSQGVKDFIQRIVEAAFDSDDIARDNRLVFMPLGDDCDRASWEKVRSCWLETRGEVIHPFSLTPPQPAEIPALPPISAPVVVFSDESTHSPPLSCDGSRAPAMTGIIGESYTGAEGGR